MLAIQKRAVLAMDTSAKLVCLRLLLLVSHTCLLQSSLQPICLWVAFERHYGVLYVRGLQPYAWDAVCCADPDQ